MRSVASPGRLELVEGHAGRAHGEPHRSPSPVRPELVEGPRRGASTARPELVEGHAGRPHEEPHRRPSPVRPELVEGPRRSASTARPELVEGHACRPQEEPHRSLSPVRPELVEGHAVRPHPVRAEPPTSSGRGTPHRVSKRPHGRRTASHPSAPRGERVPTATPPFDKLRANAWVSPSGMQARDEANASRLSASSRRERMSTARPRQS